MIVPMTAHQVRIEAFCGSVMYPLITEVHDYRLAISFTADVVPE